MPPNINNNLSHICNNCYKPVRLCNCLTDQQLRRTQQLLELNRLREVLNIYFRKKFKLY